MYKRQVETTDGKTTEIDNPSKLPDPARITNLYEPYVRIDIHVPSDYVGNVMKLCEEKRGIQKNMGYLAQNRVVITYELPFAEIVFDFFDRLKSATRGYASMDYEVIDYRASNLVRLDILLNGEAVDALAVIVHKDKDVYKRQLFSFFRGSAPAPARDSIPWPGLMVNHRLPFSGNGINHMLRTPRHGIRRHYRRPSMTEGVLSLIHILMDEILIQRVLARDEQHRGFLPGPPHAAAPLHGRNRCV